MGGYKDHRERTERAVFLPAVLSPEVWASRWWHTPPACTGLVATHKKRKLACGFTGYIDLTSNRASPQSPHFFLPSSSQGLCQTHFTRPDLQEQAQGLGSLLASLGVFHSTTVSSGLPLSQLEQPGHHNPPQMQGAANGRAYGSLLAVCGCGTLLLERTSPRSPSAPSIWASSGLLASRTSRVVNAFHLSWGLLS